jgi:hypothetical protein
MPSLQYAQHHPEVSTRLSILLMTKQVPISPHTQSHSPKQDPLKPPFTTFPAPSDSEDIRQQ